MKIIRYLFFQILLILLLIINSTCIGIGQERPINCQDDNLKTYADSLRMLITHFNPDKVIQISDSLLQEHSNLVCPDMVRIKANRAYAYESLFNFEAAIEIYNNILKTAKKNQFTKEEIIIRMSLARVYESIDRPELCEQFLDDIEKLFETYENKKLMSHYYVRVASYHRIYKDRDVAIEYARRAISLGEESGRLGSLAGGNMILGMLTKDFDESMEYFKASSNFMYEEGDYVGYLFQELNIAKKYLKVKDYKRSIEVINEVQEKAEGLTENQKINYEFKTYLSRIKAELYEELGEKDSLIVALKEINKYSALFGDVANQEKINQLIIENVVQQEHDKIESAKKRNQLLTIGLFSLLGITLMILRFYLINRSKSKKIEEQTSIISSQFSKLEKLYNYQSTLLSEVHHRIKNNLQLIISLLTLQKSKLNNDVKDGILDMLSYRISSISLIHEQLYTHKEFEKIDVGLYVRDLVKNFINLTIEKGIIIDYDMDDIFLNLETIIPLGLIWSELISNSLKYNSKNKGLKIHFDLIKEEKDYTMNYNDNGVGYPDGHFKANDTGMGFTIINSLSRQLSATSKTYNSNGAHFTITFKEKIISPL